MSMEEESDILKNRSTFDLPPYKVYKSDVFVIFEINSFLTTNLKDKKGKNELKAKLSYFANSYVSRYKPNTNVLRKHGIL